jgi:FtsP/CotA-like multicopper oxidase with cupredoxin domain/rubrerythrin
MKRSIIMVMLFGISFFAAAQTKTIYTCPMHPQIKMNRPGSCPICGMTLVKKTIKSSTPQKTVSAPAKKPTVKKAAVASPKNRTNAKPTDTTDLQGQIHEMRKMLEEMQQAMNEMKTMISELKGSEVQRDTERKAQKKKQLGQADKIMDKVIYTCVMHPQIQQEKPGKCPICGMTLVRKTIRVPAPIQPDSTGMDMNDSSQEKMNTPVDPFNQVGSVVNLQPGKTVRYDLYVKDTMVNYTGKSKHAIAINGSIPGPALVFTEGDTAEIYLHNMLKEETSLHWHGVILPNRYDGVPFLTTAPIHSGETHLYKFKIVQNGTYWYHSHSALQEQVGMYGALIFKTREGVQKQTDMQTMDHSMHAGMNMDNRSSINTSADSLNEKQYTVVLSEWSDENPMQTQRRLRTGNDWFSIKKGSTQSYAEAIAKGYFKTKLMNEWKRMKAMDVSDDWYQRFLVNGQPKNTVPGFKAGDKIKLHVVNAGASTYFWLGYAGGKITVIGNDGNDMVPVSVDRLIIAPSETYDLLVTIPENMSYEFRATAEDRTGASSLWLGDGMKMSAPILPRLKYFEGMKMMNDMMRTNGTMKDMGMNMSLQKMDMNMVMYPEVTGGGEDHKAGNNMQHDMSNMAGMDMPKGADLITLNYDMLRSPVKTSLPSRATRTLHFSLTGNMNRYLWTLDNKTVTETDRILINKGENLQLIITNNSMMRHPMHLHGHDFRVLNSQREYSPLKNVIDILPMETDTIEFAANQDGNWFFHCHILFHMMAGMGRVFTYANSPANPELPDANAAYRKFKNHRDQNMKHLMVRAGLESNGSDGEMMLSENRYAFSGLWHLGTMPQHGYEGELALGRYLGVNQWWFPYIGYDYHYKKIDSLAKLESRNHRNMFQQVSDKNNRSTVTFGIQYITPWLMLADARVDANGKFRFQLSREDIPVTARLRLNIMGNTDKEYMAGFRYIVNKWFALSTHYDSDMGPGAGVTLTY